MRPRGQHTRLRPVLHEAETETNYYETETDTETTVLCITVSNGGASASLGCHMVSADCESITRV